MSHLQVPGKKFLKPKSMSTPSDKCEHIDCECSTHTAESSEHVLCKWDTSRDQLMSQFSPLASSNLESMSTASCIDTGGIRMTSSLAMPKPSLVAPRPSLARTGARFEEAARLRSSRGRFLEACRGRRGSGDWRFLVVFLYP